MDEQKDEAGDAAVQSCLKAQDYVLVRVHTQTGRDVRYAAIVVQAADHTYVNFLKEAGRKGLYVNPEDEDGSYVMIDDVIRILPPPRLDLRGNRIFLAFDCLR